MTEDAPAQVVATERDELLSAAVEFGLGSAGPTRLHAAAATYSIAWLEGRTVEPPVRPFVVRDGGRVYLDTLRAMTSDPKILQAADDAELHDERISRELWLQRYFERELNRRRRWRLGKLVRDARECGFTITLSDPFP